MSRMCQRLLAFWYLWKTIHLIFTQQISESCLIKTTCAFLNPRELTGRLGGGGGFFFLPGSGIFLVKYFPMLTETSPPTISLLSLCCYFKNTLFFSHVSGIDETPQWLLCWNAKKCVTYSLCEEIRIGKSVSSFTKQALPQGQVFLSNYWMDFLLIWFW